jgi:hypothetical protein
VIRWFWEVVHSMSDEDKKRLLFFCTGCDRVAVGGFEHMKFIVAKQVRDARTT